MNPIIMFGEPIENSFFLKLLKNKNSKYLNDFKRYFYYLKKNLKEYKYAKIRDIISIDRPLIDYVHMINDWLEYETKNKYTLYIDKDEYIYFGFKFVNPVDGDKICQIVKDWKKKKELRNDYFDWISMFDENPEGPIFFAVN